jgi:hypothetical protein
MTSLKLEPLQHPIKSDTILRLFLRGALASCRRFDISVPMKLAYVLWFVAIAPAPKPLAHWLAEKLFFPETRGRLNKLLAVIQAVQSSG